MNLYKLISLSGLCLLMVFSFSQCNENSATEVNAQEQTAQADSVKTEDPPENAVLVETSTLKARTMRSYILLSTTIETENMVDVYPQVTGIIRELKVEEGDRVGSQTVLVKLDDREQKIAEQKAKVNVKKRENDYNRVKESFEKNLISKSELDNAKYEYENADLTWKETQLNLSYTGVTAPIKGVVTERFVRKGDRVQPSTKLFQVVDTSEKIARVFIPEKDISSVQVGQNTILTSEFLQDKQFSGFIKRISPVVDPNSGTFKVTIGVKDPDNSFRPGMFVSARIITSVHENVIAVPKDALVYDAGMPFIFVVRDKKAHKIPLVQGFADENFIESLEGLSHGDQIIVVGQSGLKDKTSVRIMTANGGY